ncbi:kelch-like protein 9 [Pomacea canaliculata]|nr:kelch-like protein 9 [Pomacea canaliculata]XP_025105558.1 kelch-like protein 9 [Pomacea canaliculata]
MHENHDHTETFDFLLLFDLATGSPKVNYFMVDPRSPSHLLPKMNSIKFKQLKDVSAYRPVVLNHCLYIIGGRDWNTGTYLANVRKYDPRVNHWSQVAPMTLARCRFTAVALDGYVYVVGGETFSSRVTDSVERYDPSADQWTEVASLPRARADHASCSLGGRIYVSGGISNLKHQCSNVFWVYDPFDNTWRDVTEGSVMPYEREKHNMVAVGSTKIFFMAGRGFEQDTFDEKDEAEVCHFNADGQPGAKPGAKPVWDVKHPATLHPHSNGAAVLLGRNIWMLGGLSFTKGVHVRMSSFYDVTRRRWRDAFPLPKGSFANVDCCLLTVGVDNKAFSFADRLIYDRWIMW